MICNSMAIASEAQIEIAFEIKKQKSNVFTLPVCFIGSYTKDEPDFPRQNFPLILQ